MRKQKNGATTETKQARRKLSRRIFLLWCSVCLVVVLLSASGIYALVRPHTAVVPSRRAAAPHIFKPVVGDVHDPEDNDPDITMQQPLIPAFQFKIGGYTLSGNVVDVKTGKPINGAVVWIDLPVQIGQPTSLALHTVTDANGNYQLQHIAQGSYTVVASRYYNPGDDRFYAERIFSVVLNGNRAGVRLPLMAITLPGKRSLVAGRAKNIILIDLRGFYAASLLNDPLLLDQTRNLRTFLQQAHVMKSVWLPYGWRPLDQYALLTGTYPSWNTYDPWLHPVPWGVPDHIDTTFWFTGGRNQHLFGQESIFDVAKSYGMQTGVVAGNDYILSDATTRSLDFLQRSSTFSASRWLMQMEDAVLSGQEQANGFLLYSELASLSSDDGSSSPDAQGDNYQQALLLADQTFGQFLAWLEHQGLRQNTLIAFTTSQAQATHADADNFYGMGSTGQGTSKQAIFALAGPGQCAGFTDDMHYSGFMIASTLMHASGLPAPAEARLPSLLQGGGCS